MRKVDCNRSRGILVLFILAGALTAGIAAEDGTILWHQDLDQASTIARESNRPMMLDFWAGWCVPCKVMDDEVYSNKDVIDASKKFVFVRVDFDKEKTPSRKYNVESLPFVIFTDSYGTELFRFGGLINAKAFTELIHSLPADVTEINRLGRLLARDKNSFEALEGMGRSLRADGLYVRSNDYYKEALKRDAARNDPRARETIMMAMGLNYLELKEFKTAIRTFEKCLKDFQGSPNRADAMFGLGQSYAGAGERKKAGALLNKVAIEYPQSRASQKAKELLNSMD